MGWQKYAKLGEIKMHKPKTTLKQLSSYPTWICADCGEKYGKRNVGTACWHIDKCEICGEEKACTEPKDFGHLDLKKISWPKVD